MQNSYGDGMKNSQKTKLAQLVSEPIKWDCPLARYTSFAIGGPAAALCTAGNRSELQKVVEFALENSIPWRVIGRGTNLLVDDSGFPGIIILLGQGFQHISSLQQNGSGKYLVTAGSGCSLARLSIHCMEQGLTGLEFAGGIPGTVGGAVVMNAGAWGHQMADILTRVELVTATGERWLHRHEIEFGYRSWHGFSEFSDKWVITGVELELCSGAPETIRAKSRQYQDKRRQSQPKGRPNAGSFFKNPKDDSAGRLIEASGFKGMRLGGAMVSEAHANFLVNDNGATTADVLALMELVQEKVKRDSGVKLEPEVHFI